MKKETSCINSRAILDYLEAHGVEYSGLLSDLDPELDRLEDPEAFLRDPDNWVSSGVISTLFERTAQLLGDDHIAYKIGKYATENTALGFAQRTMVKAFWSVRTGLKHAQKINDQWNRSKKVDLVELRRNEATVRLRWDRGMDVSKHLCRYNKAVYTHLPVIWGGRRLTLKETCCQFDGAPYCEYHLEWPLRNRLQEVLSRFYTPRSVLMDTVTKIERDRETIDRKNQELKDINRELQRKIEEQRESEEALKESEERYRRIFENIQDVYYEVHLDGTLLEISPSIERMSGFRRDELVGSPIVRVLPDPSTRKKLMKEILEKGRVVNGEVELADKDGSRHTCEINMSLEKGAQGAPEKLIGSMRDITERKRLEAGLLQMQKMESIGTLAGGIAHNFNNILMSIQGRISLMMMDKDENHPDFIHIKGVEHAVDHAAELTQGLLGFARGGKYEVKPTDLNDLIDHESRMFGQTKKEIRVHGDYAEDLWAVDVDQGQMRQALLNLFVNAGQAMPGEGDLYVQTENVRIHGKDGLFGDMPPGSYVKVSITDTGVGMSDAVREKIFEPFFTTQQVGQGTGLGLSSAYGIVKNHSGFIHVFSEEGRGTTFTLHLPASQQPLLQEKKAVLGLVKGEETILLVDDEEMITDVGVQLLEKLGYEVLTAKGGEEALGLYRGRQDDIALVILDMIMPGMGGGETYDRLKEIRPDLKVLLSSGYSIDGQAQEILDRGCNGFIQKPFNLEDLSSKIRETLDSPGRSRGPVYAWPQRARSTPPTGRADPAAGH